MEDIIAAKGNGNIAGMKDTRPQGARPTYTYQVPDVLARQTGIANVTLVELTAEEELMAAKRARNDVVRLASELAKECLRAVNGKPVSAASGTVDTAWNTMHPKVRQLVMGAYGRIHSPEPTDEQLFLESCQVEVG